MPTAIEPYLFFNGRCEEAFAYYGTALGAKTEMMMRFGDSPEPPPGITPEMKSKIMHASMTVGGARIMGSDGCEAGGPKFEGFSLSLASMDRGEIEKWFAALSGGGKVTMPLAKTFWCPLFGMVTDRFGVNWMLSLTPAQSEQ